MKKILGISLVAVLAATPLMAGASSVSPIDATGTALTTQSYVKGAYNALGTVINTKQDQITAGGTDISTSVVQSTGANAVHTVANIDQASDTALISEKAVLSAISAATYNDTALSGRVTANEDAIDVLNGDAETPGSVAAAVAAEESRATLVEQGLDNRLDDAESAISTLNGNAETAGSVDYKINQALTSVNNNASSLESRVSANEDDIALLKAKQIPIVSDWSTNTVVQTTISSLLPATLPESPSQDDNL